jgi:hypothetical protein
MVNKMSDKRKDKSKEDLMKSLTKEQKERVELMLEVDNRLIRSGDAFECGVRCDPVYMNFHRLVINIRSVTENILSLVRSIDVDKQKLLTNDFDVGKIASDYELSIRLKNTNMNIELRKLWEQIAGLYQCVDVERIDRKIILKREEYEEFVNKVKETLKSKGINLYQSPLLEV